MTKIFLAYTEDDKTIGVFDSIDAAMKGIEQYLGDKGDITDARSREEGWSFSSCGNPDYILIDAWVLKKFKKMKKRITMRIHNNWNRLFSEDYVIQIARN